MYLGNRKVMSTKIVKRDGEWIVQAYDEHGKRFKEADYHTSDYDDASLTAQLMVTKEGC